MLGCCDAKSEFEMADHDHASHSGSAMDYPEHEKTYERFVSFAKWGTIVVILIVAWMAIFIA